MSRVTPLSHLSEISNVLTSQLLISCQLNSREGVNHAKVINKSNLNLSKLSLKYFH